MFGSHLLISVLVRSPSFKKYGYATVRKLSNDDQTIKLIAHWHTTTSRNNLHRLLANCSMIDTYRCSNRRFWQHSAFRNNRQQLTHSPIQILRGAAACLSQCTKTVTNSQYKGQRPIRAAAGRRCTAASSLRNRVWKADAKESVCVHCHSMPSRHDCGSTSAQRHRKR